MSTETCTLCNGHQYVQFVIIHDHRHTTPREVPCPTCRPETWKTTRINENEYSIEVGPLKDTP